MGRLREGLLANHARIRPFPGVGFDVRIEDVSAGESLSAGHARERFFTRVGTHVNLQDRYFSV